MREAALNAYADLLKLDCFENSIKLEDSLSPQHDPRRQALEADAGAGGPSLVSLQGTQANSQRLAPASLPGLSWAAKACFALPRDILCCSSRGNIIPHMTNTPAHSSFRGGGAGNSELWVMQCRPESPRVISGLPQWQMTE